MIDALCNLKDHLIILPNQDKKMMENIKNSDWKRFLGVIKKLDGTNIVLKFKLRGIFKKEIFFNQKKRYALDLYTVCDSSKKKFYIFVGWPNLQHDARIFTSTSIH